jgi:N-acetylglucosamine repressor
MVSASTSSPCVTPPAMKTKFALVTALESSLIQHIRLREGVSRVDLARAMDVAPSTVGLYVDRLIRDGFLKEGSKSRGQAGRPPVTLELNPQAGQFVGVDFEARQLSAVSVDFSQQIIRSERRAIRASDNANSVVGKIEEAVAAVTVPGRALLGVGIAVPGAVDDERGVALHYEFIRDWRDVPLVELLNRRFDVPIFLENNIRSMALAERWFGCCLNVEDFICVGIRSGIGAGVVINGLLHRGKNNLAGEIGRWRRALRGEATSTGTLEQEASVRAILQQLASSIAAGQKSSLTLRPRRALRLEDVLQAARDGDRLVVDTLQRAAKAIGEVVSQWSLLLNPQQVVVAGPLASLGDIFLEPMQEVVASLAPPLHATPPRIVASQLGDVGGALGAAAIALHEFKPAR